MHSLKIFEEIIVQISLSKMVRVTRTTKNRPSLSATYSLMGKSFSLRLKHTTSLYNSSRVIRTSLLMGKTVAAIVRAYTSYAAWVNQIL